MSELSEAVKANGGVCVCPSSPPGFVARDGIHCGNCHGHFPGGKPCTKHGFVPTSPPAKTVLMVDFSTGEKWEVPVP